MNQIKLAGDFSSDVARESTRSGPRRPRPTTELRTLRDLEMGWVAGGDGGGVWPY